MAAPRVRIDKNAAEILIRLVDTDETTGPFLTYADVLVFAAAFGAKHKRRKPLEQIAKEPSPISLEVFISRGYDWFIKMLAIAEVEDITLISTSDEELEAQRITIFEEYANGGLEKLRADLRGSVDYTEHILLILAQERVNPEPNAEEFDLSRFLV